MFLKTLRWPMIAFGLTALIGSAQARDRGFEADASVSSLYNQGYIFEACWEAYNKNRQWNWMLWCANHFLVNGNVPVAVQFFDHAHAGALAWAEYGWGGGNRIAGCDRAWGIQGLRAVANSVIGLDVADIRQRAANNLGRITSQNPPNVLLGPWVWPGVGNISIRQYGAGFDGVTNTAQPLSIVYDRANPFRRWRDPNTNQLTPWWVGTFAWSWARTTGWQNGGGYIWVHELSPTDAQSTCRPTIQWWAASGRPPGTQVTLTRP